MNNFQKHKNLNDIVILLNKLRVIIFFIEVLRLADASKIKVCELDNNKFKAIKAKIPLLIEGPEL